MQTKDPEDGIAPWNIWVDTGGTFTDGLAVGPDGVLRRVKLLSTSALRGTIEERLDRDRFVVREDWSAPPGLIDGFRFRVLGGEAPERLVEMYDPEHGLLTLAPPETDDGTDALAGAAFEVRSAEEAPVLAARLLTCTPAGDRLPPTRMRLATTLGTNALLQRAGVPTALFITEGFGDLLVIGDQQRPDLFALEVRRPIPLYDSLVEVPERLASDGHVIRALDVSGLEPRCRALVERGVRSAAIALLHGYRNPAHERTLEKQLGEWGFEHISASANLAPQIKLLPRAETAVVDAYLAPVVRSYVEHVRSGMAGGDLLMMTSAGGLFDTESFRPKDSLLSGPAGGVVGAAAAGRAAGCKRIIGFDMGGTSTDVARWDGDYEYQFEHRVGDARLVAPALSIETVAAGGGSICWLDGERLRVGPRSAGADPGPACYGARGPLTLTDVNLLVGRLVPERFGIPIRIDAAEARLEELRAALDERTGQTHEAGALLEGLLGIANETMADAIRTISVRRGYDPGEYALVAFGGAGAQHACGVATKLGIERIVVPPDAALLSALGLGRAVVERFISRQVLQPLCDVEDRLEEQFEVLGAEARRQVESAGIPDDEIELRRRILHLRFEGQDATVDVEWQAGFPVAEAFERRYTELFGHRPERRAVELESMRVVASSIPTRDAASFEEPPSFDVTPTGRVRGPIGGRGPDLTAFERDQLEPGATLSGPALVLEPHSTTVVEDGWRACVDGGGALSLERVASRAADTVAAQDKTRDAEQPEAIRLELFTQRFHAMVREMGERLERTAVSTNVKERLDFSCALLDAEGRLVVNAPHIPVHLGALGLCVRELKRHLSMADGDVIVTNHPSFGGSHLPDVTVVTPVHATTGARQLIGYVASRAHHAEIGGSRPGSMPPAATRLAEEGVVITPRHLVRNGVADWGALRTILEGGAYPSRNVEDNLADLRAAVAANHAGAVALREMARTHGDDTLRHYMRELHRLAESRIREALAAIPDGTYEAEERLDDGSPLRVRIELQGDAAQIDFAGTADTHPGNLNATPAIVHSVVIYVLRLLLHEPLPLNEGLLDAVTIELPPGLLNPAFPDDPMHAPAVVGGNVETSQRLTDTLIRALGLAACSQGTMNNLIFGNPSYGYYETIGGGSGAGKGFHGASGVQCHMTNTRMTDPEIVEHRYPVRVERFSLRRDSGGPGRWRGGDGIVREIRFLEPASVSMLTQHRVEAPYGLAGGSPGLRGSQRVVRASGDEETLGPIDGCEVVAGDRLVIETPGGGGYGAPVDGSDTERATS